MFNVKVFSEYQVAVNRDGSSISANGIKDPIIGYTDDQALIQSQEPCVLISAKDLYRMIHGKDQSVANKVTDFINKLKDVRLLSDYKDKLDSEITSIEVDWYCATELEDAAFRTGSYRDPGL